MGCEEPGAGVGVQDLLQLRSRCEWPDHGKCIQSSLLRPRQAARSAVGGQLLPAHAHPDAHGHEDRDGHCHGHSDPGRDLHADPHADRHVHTDADARTATSTATPTRSATLTPTKPPTKTPTPTPTATRTATPTPTPTPPTCSDPYEPNDTFATAHWLDPIDPGGVRAFICTTTDTDYFAFGVALRDEIRLTLNELPKNYDLELYDPSGTRLRFSTNAGTAPETISYTASNVGGAFRARVLGAAGQFDATARYHLRIEIIPFVEPVLVVNSANDVNDGTCNAAHCSLREALIAVNAGTAGRVQFSIPLTDAGYFDGVWTIRPATALPTVTRSVKIEGDTQATSRGDTNPSGRRSPSTAAPQVWALPGS